MTIKTRFCPSPTGYIHIGNARTALFNALAAKSEDNNGVFLLRIEDTDQERSKLEFVTALEEDLKWLGCDWQEGPGAGLEIPEHAPYSQSERLEIYEKYYQELLSQNLAYPCFCSEEELELSRKRQRRMNKPPRYMGTCKKLTSAQIAEKKAAGIQPTLRFAMPENELIEFNDLVRGHQKFNSDDLGDLIIRKADGMPTFMFCNAIDDALMGVNIALRGEDHLTNTPRQLLILKCLGLTAPQYGHISLITGDDNAPLSKRNGSKSIRDMRAEGYLPLAIVNYLARLGHVYTDHNELMSFADCASYFSLEKLVKAPARYDEAQALHWQKLAVLDLDFSEFKNWLGNINLDLSLVSQHKQDDFLEIIKPNIILPSEIAEWAERLFGDENNIRLEKDLLEILQEAGVEFFNTAVEGLTSNSNITYQELCEILKTKLNIKGKKLFMPLRVILTGQKHGPEMAPVFELLGREKVLNKFEKLKEKII